MVGDVARAALVGIGIVAAGTLLPQPLRLDLVATWLGLGVPGPDAERVRLDRLAGRCAADPPDGVGALTRPGWPTLAVTPVYALFALGPQPHMAFFVDFVACGWAGVDAAGAAFWVLSGWAPSPVRFAAGWLGTAWLCARPFRPRLPLQLTVALIPLLAPDTFRCGLRPGHGRLHPRMRPSSWAGWPSSTTAATTMPPGPLPPRFALTQADGAYGYSWLYARSHGYAALFFAAAVALIAALALSVIATGRQSRAV